MRVTCALLPFVIPESAARACPEPMATGSAWVFMGPGLGLSAEPG